MSDDPIENVNAMNALHIEIGRKAAELALSVLASVDVNQIPVATAVALLKFGVDLERKALVGVEGGGSSEDPFEALSKAMGKQADPDEKEA